MKKTLLILLVLSVTLSGCSLFRKKKVEEDAPQKLSLNEPVNVIAVSSRPYINLIPAASGQSIDLEIVSIAKEATDTEYELEYQAGTLLRGATGTIELDPENLPLTEEIKLGTCSTGGTCTYDTDISGGSLEMQFAGPENYAVKFDWRYFETDDADGLFASKDSKFQVDAGKIFDSSTYVIVMQTSGLPAELEGEVLSDPYGIFTSSTFPANGEIDLSMRLSEDVESATIYGWDGSQWQAFETQVADKTATATVDAMKTYIVTK